MEGFDWDEGVSRMLQPSSYIKDVVILDNPKSNVGTMYNPFESCCNVGTISPIKQLLDLTGTTSEQPFLHDDKLSGYYPGFAAGPGVEVPEWVSNMTCYNAEDLYSIVFPSAQQYSVINDSFNSNKGASTKVCAIKATEIKDNGPPRASTKVREVKAIETKDNGPTHAFTKVREVKTIEIKDNGPPNEGASTKVCEVKATEIKDNGPPDKKANVGSSTQTVKIRSPNEKIISMTELRQYFTGNIEHAAKCLGVAPATVRRICRQNGIPRWPYRKVNRSPQSLLSGSEKLVTDASLTQFDQSKNLCIATPTSTFYQPFQTARSSLQGNGDNKNKAPIELESGLGSPNGSFPFSLLAS